MNTKNLVYTIGGPESPIGTPEARTHVIPIRDKPAFREEAEKLEDPAIVGVNMVIGEYLAALNLNGGIPISPRPCAGFGKPLNSLLGQEGTPDPVGAVIRLRYNGSSASAKISASPIDGTLTSEIGTEGSEAGDTNFGTTGDIDLTDVATDTVAELVAVIDAYDDYECETLTGATTLDAAEILTIEEEQGKERWVYIYFGVAATAVIRLRYTGSEASALITANTTADTLVSEIGDLGSEAGDTNFGTAGSLSLTDVATDTVGELAAVIEAYADYECDLVNGAAGFDAAEIIDITDEQAADTWVYVYFGSAASGVHRHQWPVILTNTARPGYSVQADGIHDNFLGTGVVFDQMTLSGALKAMVEGDFTALGFTWTGSQAASTEEPESVPPFLFYNGSFSINGVKHPFIRNASVEISNNHNTEGYGQNTTAATALARQYHDKGMFNVTASIQVKYSADIYALAAMVKNNAQVGMDLYYKTPSALTGSIYGLLIIEAPYCNISDYEATDNGGALDASINLRVINKVGAYGSPFRVTLLTTDSAAY